MKSIRGWALAATLLAGCQGERGAPQSRDDRPVATILAESGLAAADSALTGRQQTAETGFQLGAVRFLRAIETLLQVRYESYNGEVDLIPGMMTPLPPNPNPRFTPDFVERAFKGSLEHLAGATEALKTATDGEFATELPLDAVWFDIDSNGQRADWESLRTIMQSLGAQADWDAFGGTIRFDTADAEWLAAYVHLMSGTSELVMSLDPTSAIKTVYEGRVALERAGAVGAPDMFFGGDEWIDMAAAVLITIDGKAEAVRTRAALEHYRQMIAHNRRFWSELMTETDNDREWLPNPRQTSPFGIEITDELATSWQSVLVELEDMLEGRTLIPFWRTPPSPDGSPASVGISLRKLLTDPGDMNVALLIQGAAVAPYLERGKLISMEAWARFATLTRGDGLLMALILN